MHWAGYQAAWMFLCPADLEDIFVIHDEITVAMVMDLMAMGEL